MQQHKSQRSVCTLFTKQNIHTVTSETLNETIDMEPLCSAKQAAVTRNAAKPPYNIINYSADIVMLVDAIR